MIVVHVLEAIPWIVFFLWAAGMAFVIVFALVWFCVDQAIGQARIVRQQWRTHRVLGRRRWPLATPITDIREAAENRATRKFLEEGGDPEIVYNQRRTL